MFVDSARPQPVGPCDRSECQTVPAHFALEFDGGRCVPHGICDAIFLCAGLLRGRARRDRMMYDVSIFLAAFAARLDALHSDALRHASAFAVPPGAAPRNRPRTSLPGYRRAARAAPGCALLQLHLDQVHRAEMARTRGG